MTPDEERTRAREEEDQVLLAELRSLWEKKDPVPQDLADRIIFALSLEDLEFELMALQADEPVLATARGEERVRSVTFSGESLTVLVSIDKDRDGHVRLDGWIGQEGSQDDELEVELRCGQAVLHGRADTNGRFAFEKVPAGLVQLIFHPAAVEDGGNARIVVTPALQL